VPTRSRRNDPPLHRLFLHFFDVHFIDDLLASGTTKQHIVDECGLAIRLALLCAGTVFIPAAAFYENAICRAVVGEYAALFGTGRLVLVGGADSPREFAEEKLAQYDSASAQAVAYDLVLREEVAAPPFQSRRRSATEDVRTGWLDVANAPAYLDTLFGGSFASEKTQMDRCWREIPEALEGRAFTPEYVQPLLLPDSPLILRRRVAGQINRSYFASYSTELRAGYVDDLIYLGNATAVDDRFGNLPFKQLRNELVRQHQLQRIVDAAPEELEALRGVDEIAMTIVSVMDRRPTGTSVQPRLDELEPALDDEVDKLRAIRSGTANATKYHRHVAALVTQIFAPQLGHAIIEKEINEGRKRLDVFWPNQAFANVFGHLGSQYNARNIVGECKNYASELKNPEIDQLLGRFSRQRGEVGFLLCRKVRNRERTTKRCRDAFIDGRGMALVLDDDDVAIMAGLSRDGGWESTSAAGWLYHERVLPLM